MFNRMRMAGSTLSPAEWNPSDRQAQIYIAGLVVYTLGSSGNTAIGIIRTLSALSSGKWYFEANHEGNNTNCAIGLATASAGLSTALGMDADGWGLWVSDGHVRHNGITITTDLGPFFFNKKGRVALDLDAGSAWFGVEGAWANSGDPAAGTNPTVTGITGPIYASWSDVNGTGTDQMTANFGASAFSFTVPAGFNAGFGL